MFDKVRKGIKKYMDNKIQSCKEFISSSHSMRVIGLIVIGTGLGLVAASYVKA